MPDSLLPTALGVFGGFRGRPVKKSQKKKVRRGTNLGGRTVRLKNGGPAKTTFSDQTLEREGYARERPEGISRRGERKTAAGIVPSGRAGIEDQRRAEKEEKRV